MACRTGVLTCHCSKEGWCMFCWKCWPHLSLRDQYPRQGQLDPQIVPPPRGRHHDESRASAFVKCKIWELSSGWVQLDRKVSDDDCAKPLRDQTKVANIILYPWLVVDWKPHTIDWSPNLWPKSKDWRDRHMRITLYARRLGMIWLDPSGAP